MVDSTLVEMFKFNKWANLRLLHACAELSDGQLDASAEGTYGRIRDTLVHLLAAEERYVLLFRGQQSERPLRERREFPGFDELRALAEANGAALAEIAASDPGAEVLHPIFQGETHDLRAVVPLIQAIHHANDHRTQIATVLSQQGIEPPDLSAWAYGEAMGY